MLLDIGTYDLGMTFGMVFRLFRTVWHLIKGASQKHDYWPRMPNLSILDLYLSTCFPQYIVENKCSIYSIVSYLDFK